MAVKPQSERDRYVRYQNELKYKAYKESHTVDLTLLRNNAEASLAQARRDRRQHLADTLPTVFKLIFGLLLFFSILGYALNRNLDGVHMSEFMDRFNTEWLLNTLAGVRQFDFFWFNQIPKINFSSWVINFGSLGSISFDWLKYPIEFLFNYIVKPLLFIFTGLLQIMEFVLSFIESIVSYLQA